MAARLTGPNREGKGLGEAFYRRSLCSTRPILRFDPRKLLMTTGRTIPHRPHNATLTCGREWMEIGIEPPSRGFNNQLFRGMASCDLAKSSYCKS